LAHGLANVGAIHLIRSAIAELGGGVGGLAEWAVEGRGKFRGVGKNGNILESSLVEGFPNSSDAAVHHVGRSDDVNAGASDGDRCAGKQFERGVVDDLVGGGQFSSSVIHGLVEIARFHGNS